MNNIVNHTAISEVSTLLVLHHRSNSVGIVQAVSPFGNVIDVEPKPGVDTIMQINSSGSSFTDFYADFYHQLKNPSEYSFFKVSEYEAHETAISLQKYVEASSDSERSDLEDYTVSIEAVETFRNKRYADRETSVVNNDFKSDSSVLRSNFKYRYQIEDIPWERLAEMGFDRERLESIGALESLLKGYKTAMLIPILLRNGNSVNTVDARLQLRLDNRGEVVVRIHPIQDKPDFERMFGGHRFSKEDKMNLLKFGNMGRVVGLVDEATGELVSSLVSMDRLTNELISLRMDFVRIPQVICGVTLSSEQRKILREGKRLFVENMLSKKGRLFSATLQFSTDKQAVEFLFDRMLKEFRKSSHEEWVCEVPTMFRGRYLRKWQMEKLKAGEMAYINGLVSELGKKYQGYMRFDKEAGRILFSFKNPNTKKKLTT